MQLEKLKVVAAHLRPSQCLDMTIHKGVVPLLKVASCILKNFYRPKNGRLLRLSSQCPNPQRRRIRHSPSP